jgi:GH24 family phage-related lysozyme (muramidase)
MQVVNHLPGCQRFRICHILVGGACLLATLGLEKGWTNPTAFARAAQYPKFVSGFQVITEVDFSGLKAFEGWQLSAKKKELFDTTEIAAFIADFEGEGHSQNGKLFPYRDPRGLEIIGYGYLVTPEEKASGVIVINKKPVRYREGITREQAQQLLAQELYTLHQDIQGLVAVDLTPNQRNVLLSFTYNVGLHAFQESSLLQKVNAGKHHEVPQELQRWTKVGHRESAGLVKRRQAEANLWTSSDNQ